MKTLVIAVLAGFIGACFATFMNQTSYANLALNAPQEADVNARCDVKIGFGRMTLGPNCYQGEVMVGLNGDYLYCAPISVICP